MESMNAEISERVGVLSSWASVDDFLVNGLGFTLMEGDHVASTCASVFASREMVESDEHTAENYRRRGFAVLTSCALIEACLQQGKRPNWECFWDDEPSIALAGRLGFIAQPDYPVYYWEESAAQST